MQEDTTRKNAWTNKPKEDWTEEDLDDYSYSLKHQKPIRFQFGPDTIDEDIDRFLDTILGPKPKKDTTPEE